MSLTIRYIRDDRVDGTELWDDTIEEANRLAAMAIGADPTLRVEIVNQNGSILSQHPRVMRGARSDSWLISEPLQQSQAALEPGRQDAGKNGL